MRDIYPSGLDKARGVDALMAFRALGRENGRMTEPSATGREAVSARLKLTRLATGLSQTAFSKKIGMDVRTWNNYERATSRISLDEALKVAATLGVGLDWIYRGDQAMLPNYIAEEIRRLTSAEVKSKRRETAE